MATVLEPAKKIAGESRFLISSIDWPTYEAILKALGDRPTRLTYDGGSLEFMSPSPAHERYQRMFDRLFGVLSFELRLPIVFGGSLTFDRQDMDRGLEADGCYWIQNERAVRSKLDFDPASDPPPDLAIEIEISRSALDRLAISARLRIPEVWRFDGESLNIHLLQPDGTYSESSTSRCLPALPVAELAQLLQPEELVDEGTRIREFVEPVRARFHRH